MDNFNRALIFRLVIEQGTMTAAARVLNVSPSVISKRVGELEASLGVQLLRRTTRRISLTEAGDHFYQRIRYVEGQWQSLLDETQSLGQIPKGRITIAAPPPVLNRVLVPVLDDFMSLYPDIEFELQSVGYDEIPVAGADLSLSRRLDNFDSGAFIGFSLCTYHNQLFAGSGYLKEHGIPKSLSDLTNHNCLLYGKFQRGTKWEFGSSVEATIAQEVNVMSKFVSDNTEVIISAAFNNRGIAYIPALLIAEELKRGDLIPVLADYTSKPFEMWAYYQQLDFVPLKLRAFLDYLKTKW